MPMSRVPSDPRKDALLTIRVSFEERERWHAEAEAQGVKLSHMIRHLLNEYCDKRDKRRRK